MVLINILKDNEIFQGLSSEEITEIAGLCYEKVFENGSMIFEEKSEGSEVYIIIQGKVDIQMSMGVEGEIATVHTIREREILGELSLVDKAPRSASAKAVGDITTFILDAKKFDDLVERNARIGYIIMRNIAAIVSKRLRERNIKYTETLIWNQLSAGIE